MEMLSAGSAVPAGRNAAPSELAVAGGASIASAGIAAPQPSAIVMARLDVALGVIELRDYEVPCAQHYQMTEEDNVVEMSLSDRPAPCRARFPELPTMHPRPLGEIFFFPADHAVDLELAAGRQRVIRCAFRRQDQDAPRSWSREELVAGFDVRSTGLRTAMLGLAEEVAAPGDYSTLLADGLSALVAVELRRYFRQQTERPAPGRLSVSQLRLIDERIERQGALPTIAELATECGLSTRHFFRLFRQSTGSSLVDYAARRRIEQAKALLCEDGLVIKQIAYCCGFKTAAAFSCAFRRETGLSPRAFRMSKHLDPR